MKDIEKLLNKKYLKQDIIVTIESGKQFYDTSIILQDSNDKYHLYSSQKIKLTDIEELLNLFDKYHLIGLRTYIYKNSYESNIADGYRKLVCNYIENGIVETKNIILPAYFRIIDNEYIRKELTLNNKDVKQTFIYLLRNVDSVEYNNETYYRLENNSSLFVKDKTSQIENKNNLLVLASQLNLSYTERRGFIAFVFKNEEFSHADIVSKGFEI